MPWEGEENLQKIPDGSTAMGGHRNFRIFKVGKSCVTNYTIKCNSEKLEIVLLWDKNPPDVRSSEI